MIADTTHWLRLTVKKRKKTRLPNSRSEELRTDSGTDADRNGPPNGGLTGEGADRLHRWFGD